MIVSLEAIKQERLKCYDLVIYPIEYSETYRRVKGLDEVDEFVRLGKRPTVAFTAEHFKAFKQRVERYKRIINVLANHEFLRKFEGN